MSATSPSKSNVVAAHELQKLAEFIVQARKEIIAINAPKGEEQKKNLSIAAMELDEVVQHTEQATNKIMDKCDAINRIAIAINSPWPTKDLKDISLAILEACSFQDITGQRIRKVMRTLAEIEIRVARLVALFGGTMPDNMLADPATAKKRPDEHLMEGPQLRGQGASQEDIDKLLES
ncbi:MAG: protein phosphatase CheZ [Alphaproteobacteria bacterium]